MRLVENHDRHAALGVQEVGEGFAQAGHQPRTTEGGFVAQGEQQVAVDAGDPGGGIGQVQHQVTVRVQAGVEGAHRGRFTGAAFAGDQAKASLPDQIGQARCKLLLTGRGEQVAGGDGFGEWGMGEAVVFLEHGQLSTGPAADVRSPAGKVSWAKGKRPSCFCCWA